MFAALPSELKGITSREVHILTTRAVADDPALLFSGDRGGRPGPRQGAGHLPAQFANDMNFSGIPVVFGWASRGHVLDYVYDLNSTLTARDRLVEGVILLNSASPAGFDVVAHSVGNFLTMEAVRQTAMQEGFNTTGKVKTVILASPDIVIDVFENQIGQLPRSQRKFTS